MAKFGKPMKGHNSKSYGPLATIMPLHLPYLRDQVWHKFHWCRTTNISYWKPTKGHNRKSYGPLALFRYTQYIQSLSMFIPTFSFLAFIVPETSVTKIYKNGKIWKPMKRHNSMSYGPLATILPLHLTYLRDQVWYKFHWSRTTNIGY